MAAEFDREDRNDAEAPAAPTAEPATEAGDSEDWEPRLLRSIQARPLVSVLAAVAMGYIVARLVTRVGRP